MTPWPQPEIRAVRVPADAAIVPGGARSLAKHAAAGAWSCTVTYARGTKPKAIDNWEPADVVDSVVVRAWRGPLLVVATYIDGKFKTGWLQRGRAQPIPLGARQLSTVLKVSL